MKFKYFLRGLGVGIVFTSIVFLTAYMSGSTWKMSDKEILERAKELGMVQKEENVKDLITTTENTTTILESTDSENTTEVTTQATTEKATEATTTENATTESNTVTITVDRGSSSFPVCQKLQEAGLIDDAAEFDTFLVENGYADRIRVGEHKLTKGMSFHDIAEAISDPL